MEYVTVNFTLKKKRPCNSLFCVYMFIITDGVGARLDVCGCWCGCECVLKCVWVCMNVGACVHTCVRIYACTCAYVCRCAHIPKHIDIYRICKTFIEMSE